MNKLLFSLLFGTSLIANKVLFTLGSDAIISISSDSDETTDEAENEGSRGAFGGFGVKVYDNDGEPELLIYNEYDTSGNIYCIEFDSTFETSFYNSTTCEYEEVDDSDNDVSFNDLDWEYSTCGNGTGLEMYDCDFAFWAENSERFSLIRFMFNLVPVNNSDGYYVKFSIEIEGYSWTDSTADDSLVLYVDLKDCSSDHGEVTDSSEDDETEVETEDDDDDETDETDDDTTDDETEEPSTTAGSLPSRRRVLLSSDDSREYDFETSWFVIDSYANDGAVDVFMCADDNGKIHIVYSHFESDLYQDPAIGLAKSATSDDARSESGAISVTSSYVYSSIMVAALVAIIVFYQ